MSDVMAGDTAQGGPLSGLGAIWKRLKAMIGPRGGKPLPSATNDIMLACFLSIIDVHVRRLKPVIASDAAKLLILEEIEARLRGFWDDPKIAVSHRDIVWNEAYRLERLLALIEPQETLMPEIVRRLGEADQERVPGYARLTAATEAARLLAFDPQAPAKLRPEGEAILRSLLIDILEEIHWSVQRKFVARPIRTSATRRITGVGILAFAAFLLPYIILYIQFAEGKLKSFEYWSWLPLYSAMTAGLFGALFSRLLFLQSNWDNLTLGGLQNAREYTSIFLRACVGSTGAVIVSFFLQSEVVAGGLFPKFNAVGLSDAFYPSTPGNIGPLHLIYPSQALSLLIVWSFIAGFSERLVPSLLQDTETAISKSGKSK